MRPAITIRPATATIKSKNMENDQRSSTNTKFIIMILLGDYVMPRGGSIWLSDLLYLLTLLNIGERTARSTITRMAQDGWFSIKKEGRRSHYTITPKGLAILEQGDLRIFETPLLDWDGLWHLVVYSLPEDKRRLRNHLRKQLIWLGFGRLAPGTWVSPHNRQMELTPALTNLGIEEYVNLFSGTHGGPVTGPALVNQCWDIPALTQEYGAFVAHVQPAYQASQTEHHDNLSPEQSFKYRFWLTHDFLPYLRQDPNLPAELLPQNWIGFTARQLFQEYRLLLNNRIGSFMDELVNRQDNLFDSFQNPNRM